MKGLFLLAALLLISGAGCGDKFVLGGGGTASSKVALSGSVSGALAKPSSKPSGGAGVLRSPMSGGDVKVIDTKGKIVGTATIASDGTYTASVAKGSNYTIKATKGNVCLKSFIEKADADKTVPVDPASSAIVKALSKKIGDGNLGEEGHDVSTAISSQDVSAILVAIKSDSLLTAVAQAIAADIAANANYLSTTVTAGYASTAGDADANTIAINITITVTIIVQSNAPPTPAGVTATAGDGQVVVSWTAVVGVASYNLYYSTTAGTAGVKVSGITGTSYTVTGLTNGITYYFSVSSVNGTLESAGSAQVNAAPQAHTAVGTLLQVSAGGNHTIALKSDGAISAWGLANSGQLGVSIAGLTTATFAGTTFHASLTPMKITSISSLVSVSVGMNHTIALKSDGTVWAWGDNYYGQLGTSTNIGTYNANPAPTQVSGLSSIIAISTFNTHNLALKSDGTVWAWGRNDFGQLGNGTTTDSYTPVQVSGLGSVVAIATGYNHSLALKSDGTVWTWGDNQYGQLGNGTTTNRSTPAQAAITSVRAIACGGLHSLAIKNDNTLWGWGYNYGVVLGIGTVALVYTPTQVGGMNNVLQVVGGGSHTAALKTDGTVWTCGDNTYGELGYITDPAINNPTFAQIPSLSSIVMISSGAVHMMAVKNDGTLWGWGVNQFGEVGDGTVTNRFTPVQITGF